MKWYESMTIQQKVQFNKINIILSIGIILVLVVPVVFGFII